MPRMGWNRAHETFCEKFHVSITFRDFKRRATREFKKDGAKRVKTIGEVFEENTLEEARVYNQLKRIYQDCLEMVKESDVDKVERTRKVPK